MVDDHHMYRNSLSTEELKAACNKHEFLVRTVLLPVRLLFHGHANITSKNHYKDYPLGRNPMNIMHVLFFNFSAILCSY